MTIVTVFTVVDQRKKVDECVKIRKGYVETVRNDRHRKFDIFSPC